MPNQTKSQILIATVILLMITLGIGAAVLLFSRSIGETTRQQLDLEKAYSLAKSGLEKTTYCVRENPTNFETVCNGTYSLGGGYFTVNLVNASIGSNIRADITSEGRAGKATQILKDSLLVSIPPPLSTLPWAIRYGGSGDDESLVSSLQRVSDGGYVVAGHTKSFTSDWDYFIFRTDATGNLTSGFQKVYRRSKDDKSTKLIQARDGGYILCGSAEIGSILTYSDFYVVKTDSQGRIGAGYPGSWAYTYGSRASMADDFGVALDETVDASGNVDGYIVAGYSGSFNTTGDSYLVVRTNPTGYAGNAAGGTWVRVYEPTGVGIFDRLDEVRQTFNVYNQPDGYILGGSYTVGDFMVIKINATGNVTWGQRYGDSLSTYTDHLRAIRQTRDASGNPDGYILMGDTKGFSAWGALSDYLLMRINLTGGLQWARRYNRDSYADIATTMEKTSDGGYILGGYSDFTTSKSFLAVKVDQGGNVEWSRQYGGKGNSQLYSLIPTASGYVFGGLTSPNFGNDFGATSPDVLLINADALGNIDCPARMQTISGNSTCGATGFCRDVTGSVNVGNLTVNVYTPNWNCTCGTSKCFCANDITSTITETNVNFTRTVVNCTP